MKQLSHHLVACDRRENKSGRQLSHYGAIRLSERRQTGKYSMARQIMHTAKWYSWRLLGCGHIIQCQWHVCHDACRRHTTWYWATASCPNVTSQTGIKLLPIFCNKCKQNQWQFFFSDQIKRHGKTSPSHSLWAGYKLTALSWHSLLAWTQRPLPKGRNIIVIINFLHLSKK